jgi:hypothetical protein
MVKFYTHTEMVRSGCQCQKVADAIMARVFTVTGQQRIMVNVHT